MKETQEFMYKILGSGMATLKVSNEEMDDIMKIVKSLEGSDLLIKCVRKKFKNEAKESHHIFKNIF